MTHGPLFSVQDLVDAGINAYKSREFKTAINRLLEAADREPTNWRAKLYLGMSYYHAGDLFLAANQFRYLQNNCTDSEIRQKAQTALQAINAQVKDMMPEMSQTFKKPNLAPPPARAQSGAELEWVPNKEQ